MPVTLPHWEETPTDLRAATREIKAALRERIAASGRTVDEVFAVIEKRVGAAVDVFESEPLPAEHLLPQQLGCRDERVAGQGVQHPPRALFDLALQLPGAPARTAGEHPEPADQRRSHYRRGDEGYGER